MVNTDVKHSLIRKIETLSFKALPALEQRFYDGWLLRYANGYTRRANSVNPIYGSSEDVNIKINQCEQVYAQKNRPTIFKMTNAVYPTDLDAMLADKGYHKEAETYVYSVSLVGLGTASKYVQIQSNLSTTWVEQFARLNRIPKQNRDTLYKMLSLIPNLCGYLTLIIDGETIGVALGVIEDDWMGLFDVVVDAGQRGKGYGRTIMEALFDWGEQHGASQSYLQVQADNSVATALYRSLGYAPQYAYWYRVNTLSENVHKG